MNYDILKCMYILGPVGFNQAEQQQFDRKCSTVIVHSRTNLSFLKCCELVLFTY